MNRFDVPGDLLIPDLDDPLHEALSALFKHLDEVLQAEAVDCNACGRCCRFDAFGHQMWLTNLELAFLLGRHGPPPVGEAGVCPWLDDGRCGARAGRAMGCRVFHCQMDAERMASISNAFMLRIREIAATHNVDLMYEELLRSLQAVRSSG